MKIELILPDNAIAMTVTVLSNNGFNKTGTSLGMDAFFAGNEKIYDGAVINCKRKGETHENH